MWDHPDDIPPWPKRQPCWHTILMRGHPDERPPWWHTALIRDHPDHFSPWCETTLMTYHPDQRDNPANIPPDERPPWWNYWKTTLMTPPQWKRPPCWLTTLMRDFLTTYRPDVMRDHPNETIERPPWWQSTLGKTTLIPVQTDEIPPWGNYWKTTLMSPKLTRDHPDDGPPWKNHPDERSSWSQTTLMRDHPDDGQPHVYNDLKPSQGSQIMKYAGKSLLLFKAK